MSAINYLERSELQLRLGEVLLDSGLALGNHFRVTACTWWTSTRNSSPPHCCELAQQGHAADIILTHQLTVRTVCDSTLEVLVSQQKRRSKR